MQAAIQTLDIISVNLWQMAVSLVNLVLLFLIVKKFLYKPVKRTLETRRSNIDGQYKEAEEAKAQAFKAKEAFDEKLRGAKDEADKIIKSASDTARAREKEIIEEARLKADGIVRQAEADAALELKKAAESIRKEIVEVSSVLTEKVLEREVSTDDHRRFIDSFIESIGDENEPDR